MGSQRIWRVSVLVGATALVAACGSSSPSSSSSVPTQSGDITAGVIAPFTGPAAQFGKLLSAPCFAATDLINKAGGILGKTISCSAIDDTGDPADAVPNVTKAIATTTNLDMALGLESNTAATTVPLVNDAKIPIITTNGLVAFTKNTYPYYWRLTPSDDANGAAFAVWAVQKGFKNVAVVFQNGIGSEGNLPGLTSAMPKLGGSLGLQLTIPADAASYSSEVARVINAHPDALIWSADPQTTATFMSEYKQLNNGVIPPDGDRDRLADAGLLRRAQEGCRCRLCDPGCLPGRVVVQPDHPCFRYLQGRAQGRFQDERDCGRPERRRTAGVRVRRHQHPCARHGHGQVDRGFVPTTSS